MREVAVTEGDKVAAQIQFGFSVNGFDSDDVGQYIDQLETKEIDRLIAEYIADYQMDPKLEKGGALHTALVEAAKIELGLQNFLDQGGFKAFTTTFENLGLLKQLPGISAQRLMQKGYGFAAEGDWKTAALLRAMKVMSEGLQKGTSFMEDYTYHFGEKKSLVLGSHMLEICPSIAQGQASRQGRKNAVIQTENLLIIGQLARLGQMVVPVPVATLHPQLMSARLYSQPLSPR